jgi:hypothetical protein
MGFVTFATLIHRFNVAPPEGAWCVEQIPGAGKPISANLKRGPSISEWLLPRRDAIVAWHEVPPPKSRPVGYGLIRAYLSTRNTFGSSYARSYRTLRDGSVGGRFSSYFVPGYDHAVPLGRNKFSARVL